MLKKNKILISVALFFSILSLYLILTSGSPDGIGNILNQQTKEEKAAALEENYRAKAKELFSEYESMAAGNGFTVEKIGQLKGQAMGSKIIVPAKFRDLHINFIFALDKMAEALSRKSEPEKVASLEAAAKLKTEYPWLNSGRPAGD